MSKLDLLVEAERRGILPDNKKELLSEARRRGLVDGGTQPPDTAMGTGEKYLRLFNSYIPGSSRLIAGVKALQGDNYDEALQREFRRNDEAQATADPVLGTAARTAGLAATAIPTMGIGMLNPTASGIGQTIKESARIGAGMGAPIAYLDSRSTDPYGRALDVVEGTIGGAVVGAAVPAVINAAGYPFRAAGRSLRQGVPEASAEFAAADVPSVAPATSENALMRFAAPYLANSPFGSPLADQARRSARAVEENLSRTIGRATPAEAGTEIQGMLRRNLTKPTMEDDAVKALSPLELNEATGIAPGPAYNPKPPRVNPVRTEVEPITPESILDEVAGSIAPVKPRQVDVQTNYRTIPIDEITRPPEMQARERLLTSERDRLSQIHADLADKYRAIVESSKPFMDDWRSKQYGKPYYLPRTEAEQELFNRGNNLSRQIGDVVEQYKNVDAELQKLHRAWDDLRPRLHAETQSRANTEAEVEAARRGAIQQRDAMAEAERETRRLREEALAAARGRAEEEAARKTQERRDVYAAMDRRETERLQAEADAKFRAELETRRSNDQPFEVGRSKESYPTEFAMAYEQVNRNAPRIQANILGEKTDREPTHVARLLSDVGMELRRTGKLPGFNGNPFEADGRLRKDLLDKLNGRLPSGLLENLRYNSEARATGKLTPGIRGLHDTRTEIGRSIREIKASKYSPNPRGEDEALLARLYKAWDDDIKAFAARTGDEGQTFLRQRKYIDQAYESYINGLRKPLSKVYGDKVSPEDAIGRLAEAARADRGDSQLLRAFFKVANDKGDPLKATKAILSHGAKTDDLQGFLDGYRKLSPEAREIMFASKEGRALEATIDRLVKVAERLRPYMTEDRNGSLRLRDLTRGSNLMFGAGLYYSIPHTIAVAGGMHLLARALASPRFARWLNEVPAKTAKGPNSPEFRNHMLRLRVLGSDTEEIGQHVISAVTEMLGLTSAKAGPVGMARPPMGPEENYDIRDPIEAEPKYPPDPNNARTQGRDPNYDPTFSRSVDGDRRIPQGGGPRMMPPRRFSDPSSEFIWNYGGAPEADGNKLFEIWDSIREAADKRWPGMFPDEFAAEKLKEAGREVADRPSKAPEHGVDAGTQRTLRGPSTLDVLANAHQAGIAPEAIDLIAREIGVFRQWRQYQMQAGIKPQLKRSGPTERDKSQPYLSRRIAQ